MSLLLASMFSFLTHKQLTLKNLKKQKTSSNLTFYVVFQIAVFLLSIILIPRASEIFQVNVLFLQYLWSACLSIVGLYIIARR